VRAAIVDGEDPDRGVGQQDVEIAPAHAPKAAPRELSRGQHGLEWSTGRARRDEAAGNRPRNSPGALNGVRVYGHGRADDIDGPNRVDRVDRVDDPSPTRRVSLRRRTRLNIHR